MSSRATAETTAMTDAIEAGARAIEAYIGQIFGADAPHTFAQAAIEAAIASGALVPASAVAEMRERCAQDAKRYAWLREGNAYAPEEQMIRGGTALDKLCDEGLAERASDK